MSKSCLGQGLSGIQVAGAAVYISRVYCVCLATG